MRYLVILFLTLLFSSPAFSTDNPWEINLPFSEASVEYKISGLRSGTKTIYIRKKGQESAEYSNVAMNMFGMRQQDKELIITDKNWVYRYDLNKNKGSKQANPARFFNEEFEKLSSSDQKKLIKNSEKLGVTMVAGMQGKIEKKATSILGYKCDLVDAMGTKIYSIADTGFPLKVETNAMGMAFSEEATKITKGSVPDEKFKHPNIKTRHDPSIDQMVQNQVQTTVLNLVSGKTTSAMPMAPSGQTQQGPQGGMPPMSEDQQKQMQELMKMFGGGN